MHRRLSFLHVARLAALFVSVLFGSDALSLRAGVDPLAWPAGAPADEIFPVLKVRGKTFRGVRVMSRDARSVVFVHEDGMGSARLRDLPPGVQAKLGFDPRTAPPESPPPVAGTVPARRPGPTERIASADQRLERLVRAFGTVARLAPVVSMQTDFARLDLRVKWQGRRPSCSVYALVSALEYQFFQLHGRAEDFSEEYLIWATRRVLGQVGRDGLPLRNAREEPITDSGFALLSVAQALSVYGVALESEMPARPLLTGDPAAVPDRTLIDLSRQRRGFIIGQIPGDDTGTRLHNIVHVLNAGLPVPAGMRWAEDAQSRAGLLDRQPPLAAGSHAVTFVGYESPSCSPADTVFIFKNSYGSTWGRGGYGRATWGYLEKNLLDAYVLEVRATPAR